MPYIGGLPEANEDLAKQGIGGNGSAVIYRCAMDRSILKPYLDDKGKIDGIENRTSYLMNSLLSHKTRRYGRWSLPRFIREVGSSQFCCFVERDATAFTVENGGEPRQDDFDIWLGTGIIQPWFATDRHSGVANYLYLDGHVVSLDWNTAVVDLYPDKVVLTEDGSYPE